MVTFLEKAFEKPQWTILAIIAFVCFMLSLVGSVFIMYGFARLMWYEEEKTLLQRNKGGKLLRQLTYLMSKYGFIIGIILLAIFGIINISSSSTSYYYAR